MGQLEDLGHALRIDQVIGIDLSGHVSKATDVDG
jgi:hypothetical protein